MSELNGKGPANNHVEQGRGLGICKQKSSDKEYDYGTGMGMRRQAGLSRIDKKLNIFSKSAPYSAYSGSLECRVAEQASSI